MKITESNKQLLFEKLINPWYQTDIRSFDEIVRIFSLDINGDIFFDVIKELKLLPLDVDLLRQKQLVRMAFDLQKYGYAVLAEQLLERIKEDPNLRVQIAGCIDEETKKTP